jgi:hypothetical protein|tara:strand:- start:72 stop:326 length:255 start_codon:yes stop_codon:yes gene_type:complete
MATDITNKSMDYLVRELQTEFPKQDIRGAYKKHGTIDMSKEKIRGILVFENPKKYTMTTKAKGGIIKKYSSGGAAKRGYGKARN